MAEVSTDIDPPLDLSPYVKGNALLPTHLYPVLEGHLSHLTESIDRLDNEILALESLLDATRKAQRLLKQERRAHSKIKAPIRRIPPELLGVIFGCLFGDSPFEAGEYRQFTRLASVCAAWREIMYTTPNLCKGLAIDVNEWRRHPPVREGQARLASLQASWSPWLAIVSRSSTYHLKLSAEIGGQCNEAFVRYLLSSIPAPDILTLNSRRAFHLSLRLKECPSIRHLNLTEALDTEDVPLSPLPSVFPNLQILVVDPFINISHQPPFQHGHIRVLHMRDLDGNPLQFSNFMKNLPSLCELQISSREPIGVGHTGANNTDFFSHPSLQALIVHGEDMIHLLSQVTFPAPKFFCLRSRGRSEAARAFKETLPNLFSRSHVQNLTVSLQGTLYVTFLTLVIRSLPHGSRLHLDVGHIYKPLEGNGDATITIDSDNIAELFCSDMAGDLHWLSWESTGEGPGRRSRNPLEMYIPAGVAKEHEVESRREALKTLGYDLKICEKGDWTAMLHSSLPPITFPWESKGEHLS